MKEGYTEWLKLPVSTCIRPSGRQYVAVPGQSGRGNVCVPLAWLVAFVCDLREVPVPRLNSIGNHLARAGTELTCIRTQKRALRWRGWQNRQMNVANLVPTPIVVA